MYIADAFYFCQVAIAFGAFYVQAGNYSVPKRVPWSTFKNSESHLGRELSVLFFSLKFSSSGASSLCFLKIYSVKSDVLSLCDIIYV